MPTRRFRLKNAVVDGHAGHRQMGGVFDPDRRSILSQKIQISPPPNRFLPAHKCATKAVGQLSGTAPYNPCRKSIIPFSRA